MRSSQQGVALAIVVWFLAAMSLLVAGIVYQSKMDVRLAQIHVARAEVASAGDGAINLMLAALVNGRIPAQGGAAAISHRFHVGGHEVNVDVVPVAGLVNINSASADLLSFLFAQLGGLGPAEAQQLADSVIQWRLPVRTGKSGGGQFESIEDLMRIEGVTRVLLDRVRDYIAASGGQGGGLDWSAAPPGLLGQFADKYPREVNAAMKRRDKLSDLVGEVGLSGQRGKNGGVQSGNFRVDATVIYGDKTWLRRRWVALGSSGSRGLPWQMTRIESPRVRVNEQRNGPV